MGFTAVLFLFSCSNPVSSSDDGDSSLIEAFYLTTTLNGSLSSIVIGEINQYKIVLPIPSDSSSSYYIPEFSGSYQSVTVNGIDQLSGESGHDFSNPVEYKVISSGGATAVYTVKAVFLGEWSELGTMPLSSAISPLINCRNDVFPYVLYITDPGGMMSGQYYNNFENPSWQIMDAVFGSAVIDKYAALNTNNAIWVAAVNTGFPDRIYLYKFDSSTFIWSAEGFWDFDGPVGSLHLFSTDDYNFYLSFIDDVGGMNQPEIWFYNTGDFSMSQLGNAPLSSNSTASFTAGTTGYSIKAAAVYDTEPDTIYLYEYDWSDDSWYTNSFYLEGQTMEGFSYDTENWKTILVTHSENSEDSSLTDINYYSLDTYDGSWSEYLPSLSIEMALTDPLGLDWFENRPLVASSQWLYEYIEGQWRTLGNGYFSDSPSSSISVKAMVQGYRFIAYQDPSGSNVYVKMLELE